MTRLFIDTSVLFAAVYSSRGRGRDLLTAAARGEVVLVVSKYVLAEARLELEAKAPNRYGLLDYLLQVVPYELAEPTKRQVLAAAKRVVIKDAPIVAAAKKAKVTALVTFDRKHLLGKPEIVRYIKAQVITPEAAWALMQPAK